MCTLSAYANAYASKICAGKIKDPSGVKRKDFKGRKPSAMGGRIKLAGGGLREATDRLRRQGLRGGGICKKGMNKKSLENKMAKNGLDKWFKQKWVDIGSKKKRWFHKPCGRKSASGSKRKYPKCVPAAKADG